MNTIKKIITKVATLSIVGASILASTSSPSLAENDSKLYLQMVEKFDNTVTVEVIAENVYELYGAEIRLTYDPSALAVQDADPDREGIQVDAGEFLPLDQGFPVANQVDEEIGSIVYAVTLLSPAPPVEGSGPIASITFDTLQDNPTEIQFEKAKLVAADLQEIPTELASFELADDEVVAEVSRSVKKSSASNVAAAADPEAIDPEQSWFSRWGAIAALIAIAGVGSIAFFGVGLFNLAIVKRNNGQPSQRQGSARMAPAATMLTPYSPHPNSISAPNGRSLAQGTVLSAYNPRSNSSEGLGAMHTQLRSVKRGNIK